MTASVQRIKENNAATNQIYTSIPGYFKIIVMLLHTSDFPSFKINEYVNSGKSLKWRCHKNLKAKIP